MLLIPFLVFSTLLLGYGAGRRFLGASSLWEAMSLSPLLAGLIIMGGAAAWGPVEARLPTALISGLFALILAVLPAPIGAPAESLEHEASKPRLGYGVHGLTLLMVLISAAYFSFFVLDAESWLRDPLVAGLGLGSFPAAHPFLPNATMQGGHGFELLAAALLPPAQDPSLVFGVLTCLWAIASYGLLSALFRAWGDSFERVSVLMLFVFFGFWSHGLGRQAMSFDLATFLSWALALLLFYGTLRLLELLPTRSPGHPLGLWCAVGYLLGTLSLVSLSQFVFWLVALWLLLLPAVYRSTRKLRLFWGALVASVVALIIATGNHGAFSLVGLEGVDWGYRWGAWGDSRFILEALLAVVSLLWFSRQRHWLAVSIGALSALALLGPWDSPAWPGLARLGFLLLSGLLVTEVMGFSLRAERFRAVRLLLGSVLIVVMVGPGLKAFSKALVQVVRGPWPQLSPAGQWRAQRPEFGVTQADLLCAKVLGQQILQDETLLTNLGESPVQGLWADSVIASLSGARIAGYTAAREPTAKDQPSRYRRSELPTALWASGRVDLLWNSGVDWLWLDGSRAASLREALERSPHGLRVASVGLFDGHKKELWKLDPPPSLALARLDSQPPFRSRVLFLGPNGPQALERLEPSGWEPAEPYGLQIAAFNAQERPARLGWLRITVCDSHDQPVVEPLYYLLGANPLPSGTGDLHEVIFVTPSKAGSFTVKGELLGENQTAESLFDIAIEVSQR